MRPGGLTTLAVINGIFALWKLFEALSSGVALGMAFMVKSQGKGPENMPDLEEMLEQSGMTLDLYMINSGIVLGVNLLIVPLLICSLIGYLKQKRVLGKWMGNLYGLVATAGGIAVIYFLYQHNNNLVNMFHVMGLVYPLLTLFVLNISFRKDLVR